MACRGGSSTPSSGIQGASGALHVHETAPQYDVPASRGTHGLPPVRTATQASRASSGSSRRHVRLPGAGVTRVRNACFAARRSRWRLVARAHAAGEAACDLGRLHLDRSRPVQALESFARAREWSPDAGTTLRSLAGSGEALLDQGRLVEAEAVLRTALTGRDADAPDVRRLLAETLAVRGDLDAAGEALQSGKGVVSVRALALASDIERRRGNLAAAGRLATDALGSGTADDSLGTCEARLAAMRVQAVLKNRDEVDRHAREARAAARAARSPAIALRTAAEALRCSSLCGVKVSTVRRDRLLAAAARLPLLREAQLRVALVGIDGEIRRIASRIGALSLVDSAERESTALDALERLLDAVHDADDEAAALRTIADHLLETLHACSVDDPIGAAATPGGRGRSSVADRCRDQ